MVCSPSVLWAPSHEPVASRRRQGCDVLRSCDHLRLQGLRHDRHGGAQQAAQRVSVAGGSPGAPHRARGRPPTRHGYAAGTSGSAQQTPLVHPRATDVERSLTTSCCSTANARLWLRATDFLSTHAPRTWDPRMLAKAFATRGATRRPTAPRPRDPAPCPPRRNSLTVPRVPWGRHPADRSRGAIQPRAVGEPYRQHHRPRGLLDAYSLVTPPPPGRPGRRPAARRAPR